MASSSSAAAEVKVITAENASKCTPYELRQELVRRGAMDIPEGQINFRSLLQRLMQEFVKDEEKRNQERLQEIEAKQAEERNRLKEERERRKQEALERSKQRREADPTYFEKRKVAIEEVKDSTETVEAVVEEEEPETETREVDPFRAYQSKSRNKVFVK